MKGLLYKDFRLLQKNFVTIPLIVTVFLVLSLVNQGGAFWSVYAVFIGCTLVSTLHNTDETTRWCTYCDTTPLKRSDLVKEKYVFSLLLISAIILFFVVLRLIAGIFGLGQGTDELPVTCLSMAMLGMIISSLSLTFSFLFGPQKSQIYRMALILFMVIGCMSIINYAPGAIEWLSRLPAVILIVLSLLAPLAIMCLCYKTSCIGFEKRNLL